MTEDEKVPVLIRMKDTKGEPYNVMGILEINLIGHLDMWSFMDVVREAVDEFIEEEEEKGSKIVSIATKYEGEMIVDEDF